MKRMVISMALLVLIGVPTAIAQGGNSGSNMTKSSGVPEAPVGHRQPRAGDVPSEKSIADPNNSVSKEDAILDRKIKSICRGC